MNNEHLHITDSGKHSSHQILPHWDTEQTHSKKKLSSWVRNLADLRSSTPSQSWLSDQATLIAQETCRPKYLLKQDPKPLDGIEGLCDIGPLLC